MKRLRRAQFVAGALILAVPSSAVASSGIPSGTTTVPAQGLSAAGPAQGSSAAGPIHTKVRSRHLAFGQDVIVIGSAPAADAGHTVQLQFQPAGRSSWRALGSAKVNPHGRFRIAAPLWRSGLVKVVDTTATSPVATAHAASSGAQRISVAAAIHLRPRSFNLRSGQSVDVNGRLLSVVTHRVVRLEGNSGRGWHTLATTRTNRNGGFRLHYRVGGAGQEALRVYFAGDRANAAVATSAGRVAVLRPAVASWYNDGGSTACGFHAYYGVANKSLRCGTKVTFVYGGRSVTATVDDRGPYVGGREFDLNQNTAAALGFGGVGTVWTSA